MRHPDLVRVLHEDRLRPLSGRRAVADRSLAEPRAPRQRRVRSVRRAVGRAFVRIGRAIEPEPRRPVAS